MNSSLLRQITYCLSKIYLNSDFRLSVQVYKSAHMESLQVAREASATAVVIEKMDKPFDALNSDSKDLRRGKTFATNVKKNSPHIEFFREMRKFFESMSFVECKSTPPSKEGWIWTLNAVEVLWEKINKKNIMILKV